MATKFRVCAWGTDNAVSEIEVSDNITVGELKHIHEQYKTGGYKLTLNGAEPSIPSLESISRNLVSSGMVIRVGGIRADDSTVIQNGDTVFASREHKGA